MPSQRFWGYFDNEAAPKLGGRAETFRKIFGYLDQLSRPVCIIETGCVREKDNWAGDGQSTLLFDRYAQEKPGSVVYSVDVDLQATMRCKSLVSERVKVHTGDSVAFLSTLARQRPADLLCVDLLYLDSVDVDMYAPLPSAIHHLKELLAAYPLLSAETLVVVDDSPSMMLGYTNGAEFKVFNGSLKIGGKGMLIAEYASAIGAKPYFTGYQCGWIGIAP